MSRSLSTRWLATLLLALGLCHAQLAHAGPVEQFLQLALNPNAPDVMLLRYENGGDGMFATRDGGKTWTMMCASGIDSSLIGSLSVGVAGDGTALFSGALGGGAKFTKTLWEDDKHGCAFARIGALADVWISDLQVDPTDPDVLFGVTSGLEAGTLNGLWKRKADGTWSQVGPRERMMITRLRISATSSGLRMYQSALRENKVEDAGSSSAAFTYDFVLRSSDDSGETWDEVPFKMANHASLKLEAIDPTNPDRIVVTVNIPEALGVPLTESEDHVLVSDDRGATFHEYLTLTEIGGVAFDAEGRVWIGDAGTIYADESPQGLWTAKSLSEPATKVIDDAVQCLVFQPATDTLYACQHQALAKVDRGQDVALVPVLRAVAAVSLAACEGTNVVAACEQQLCGAYCGAGHFAQAPLCEAYDTPSCGPTVAINEGGASPDAGDGKPVDSDAGGAVADAATPDASPNHDAGSAQLTGTDSDCGCRIVGRNAESTAGAAWLFAALALYTRRTRRK